MIKPILTGVWVCAATMGSAYLGAAWQRPAAVTTERQDHGVVQRPRRRSGRA